MRVKYVIGLAFAGLIFFCGMSYSHGTGYRQSPFKAVALEFMYSTGEAMSYREARVFSPSDDKFAWQSGRTDERGNFAFVPNVPGLWRVVVRDEEGHQCEANIVVSGEGLEGREAEAESSIPHGIELFIRALLGVSLIFNIAMIIRRGHAH